MPILTLHVEEAFDGGIWTSVIRDDQELSVAAEFPEPGDYEWESLPSLCRYSAAHNARGVVATTTIDCGPVGTVPACQRCADFYARMSAR
jgi:hypothetical protein